MITIISSTESITHKITRNIIIKTFKLNKTSILEVIINFIKNICLYRLYRLFYNKIYP